MRRQIVLALVVFTSLLTGKSVAKTKMSQHQEATVYQIKLIGKRPPSSILSTLTVYKEYGYLSAYTQRATQSSYINVTIKDEYGKIIYQDSFIIDERTQQITIPFDEDEMKKYTLEITSEDGYLEGSF